MKTIRQVLLEHHRSSEPKLDRIRAEVLSNALRGARRTPPASAPRSGVFWLARPLQEVWLGLFRPARRIWAGFALVWVAMWLVNWSCAERAQQSAAGANGSFAEWRVVWQQQQRLMAELIGPGGHLDADKPGPGGLRPRSERRPACRVT